MENEYNSNPFVSKGRLSGLMYFVYTILFSVLCGLLGIDFFVSNKFVFIQIFAFILTFLLLLPQLFILKKRLYDICLNNKISWILTPIIFVLFILSFLIGILIIPIILYLFLLFVPKNETLLKIWKH